MATLETLDAMLKKQYGDHFNLVPTEQEVILKHIGRAKRAKVGRDYTVAATLSLDHSTTFHGTNEETIDLVDAVDGKSANASITPSAMSFSGMITKMAAERVAGGETAFVDGPKFAIDRSMVSFTKVIETVHNHGGNGIGTFTYVAADSPVINIDNAEWATAIWVGSYKKPIDIYTAAGVLVLSTSVLKVDTQTRNVTLASTVGLVNGTAYTIYPKGAKGRESLGLFNILKKSTGSLFGLSIDDNDLWGANQKNLSTADFSWKTFASTVSEFSGRGVSGDNYMLYMNDIHFPKMVPSFNDAKAGESIANESGNNQGRWFNTGSEVMQLKHGTESIEFIINNTRAKIVTSNYVKRGEAALVNMDTWMRVVGGEGDISFEDFNGQKIRPLEKKAAYEYRLYTDQALFCPELNGAIYFYGLNPAAL